jgi:2-amino-4-hydroxy-6-hydroxymethyldihydropteridine diphosphokinase
MYYYLSLGSNIDPESNISKALELLLKNFSELYLFPPVYTVPENIKSKNEFINTLIILRSDFDSVSLKDIFNDIEILLGRDRLDKDRSVKDRVCDIDIIFSYEKFRIDVFNMCKEKYLGQVIDMTGITAKIQVFGSQLSNRPSAIYLDRRSGNKLIIKDKLNSF